MYIVAYSLIINADFEHMNSKMEYTEEAWESNFIVVSERVKIHGKTTS